MPQEIGAEPIARRPLQDGREWCTPHGMTLQLCVAHELDPDEQYSVQAIVIFQGDSLCREHLEHYSTR